MLDPILIMRDRDFRNCLKRFFSCYRCMESDYDTAQNNNSENYFSRRSDSTDIISYRGRRNSLCPSTGSASRMHGETNHDSLAVTIETDVDHHRRAHLSTVHEHLSDTSVSTNTNGTCVVPISEHHSHQARDNGDLPIQHQYLNHHQDQTQGSDENGVNHNGIIKCTSTESTDSEPKEVCICSHWTITWCQPNST